MKNELLEVAALGFGMVISVSILFTSAIESLTSGSVVSQMPSMITEQARYYGLMAIALSAVALYVFYVLLKKKNSLVSKMIILLSGGLGILLAGSQLILAHGDWMQIGISVIFGYAFYVLASKGLKR